MGWRDIVDQRGNACTDLPRLVRQLTQEAWQEAYDAFDELHFKLVGEAPCAATDPALELVIEQLCSKPHPYGYFAVTLVAELTSGVSSTSWTRPLPADTALHEAAPHEAALATIALAAASHPDSRTRAAAALLLGSVPALGEQRLDDLARLMHDPVAEVRASALMASCRLSSLGALEGKLDHARHAEASVERGAAELAWAARNRALPDAANVRHWLSWHHPLRRARVFSWFVTSKPRPYQRPDGRERDNPPGITPSPQANAVIALAEALDAKRAMLDLVVALPCGPEDCALRTNAEHVVTELSGIVERRTRGCRALPLEALEPDEQTLAAALADSPLLPHGAYGIPASGGVRRRWLGVDPPRVCEERMDTDEGEIPLWLWIRKQRKGRVVLPETMLTGRSATACYEAALILDSEAYGSASSFPFPKEHLPADAQHVEPLRPIVDEIVQRLQIESEPIGNRPLELIILPWVRSGEALPDAWACLLPIDEDEVFDEVLETVAPDHRGEVLTRMLAPHSVSEGLDVLEEHPHPEVASRLWERLAEQEAADPTETDHALNAWREVLVDLVSAEDSLAGAALPPPPDDRPPPLDCRAQAKPGKQNGPTKTQLAGANGDARDDGGAGDAPKPPEDVPMALRMLGFTRPLEDGAPSKLPGWAQQQLLEVVAHHGFDDLEAAAQSDECRSIERVDVVDAPSGRILYQLYVTASGGGGLMPCHEPHFLAELVQHHLTLDDLALYDGVARAYRRSSLNHLIRFDDVGEPAWPPLAMIAHESATKLAKVNKDLQLGDVLPIDRYASKSPKLAPLDADGTLFLVSVRPDDQLWLVAVLRAPEWESGAWKAAPNTRPVTDITELLGKLTLYDGTGLNARPGKLINALRVPKLLSQDDIARLLRES